MKTIITATILFLAASAWAITLGPGVYRNFYQPAISTYGYLVSSDGYYIVTSNSYGISLGE